MHCRAPCWRLVIPLCLAFGAFAGEDKPVTAPVTVVVVDAADNKPITEFTYLYWAETAGKQRSGEWKDEWVKANCPDGTIKLDAPLTCELTIGVKARDYEAGYGHVYSSFAIKADDKARRVTVHLNRGVTVTGTVVDAKTKKPVAGAKVSPLIHMPPLVSADQERFATSDANGRFELHGVDTTLGIDVTHADYLHTGCKVEVNADDKRNGTAQAELESGETFTGKVVAPDGTPVAGAEISDGAGKEIQTAADGSFVLRGAAKWWNGEAYSFTVRKKGYIEQDLHPKEAPAAPLTVKIEPLFEVAGQVLAPDGKPVEDFTIIAGPGKNPPDFHCDTGKPPHADGRFSVSVKEKGEAWVGVKAPGFAAWEGWADVARNAKPMSVTLKAGVTVTGTVAAAKKGGARVALVPQRVDAEEHIVSETPARTLATVECAVNADGSFRLEHVRPDNYLLTIGGADITPVSRMLTVPKHDLDIGAIHAVGTGKVVGRVFRPKDEDGKPWAFASGSIRHPALERDKVIFFKADAEGRFEVDGVPVGHVTIGISHQVSDNMIRNHERDAVVLEGQATEVHFFDPRREWEARFEIAIGDGSPQHYDSGTGLGAKRKVDNVTTRDPMLNLQLEPTAKKAISYSNGDWEKLRDDNAIVLPDVQPGSYRLTVWDWLGSRGFCESALFQQEVEIKAGKTVRVPLGAGSITGEVKWEKDYRHMIHVLAESKGGGMVHARCDDKGRFCARYLQAGAYVLLAHDAESGWCRMGEFDVKNDTRDIGTHKLAPGGAIAGTVTVNSGRRKPDAVEVLDASGATVDDAELKGIPGEAFSFTNLWPAQWTVVLKSGKEVMATTQVKLEGTETVKVELPPQVRQ